jgi:hypothetical protein
MGQGNDAGHRGCGRTGRRGASGCGGCGKNALATVPCKASKQGACKDLKGHILTIGSGNKDKDGDMFHTSNKKMAHNNSWQSHRKVMGGLKKSRSKIYSLLLEQCTQVLIDKMKQDVDWVMISDSFDPIALFKLIEKFVLKQSDNQYRTAVLIAEQLLIL